MEGNNGMRSSNSTQWKDGMERLLESRAGALWPILQTSETVGQNLERRAMAALRNLPVAFLLGPRRNMRVVKGMIKRRDVMTMCVRNLLVSRWSESYIVEVSS